MASNYSQTYRRLLEEVGSHLGFGETLEDYASSDMRIIVRCVDHGIMDFLNPINPRTGAAYRWTFAEKEVEIALAAGQYLVALPLACTEVLGPLIPRNTDGDNPIFAGIPQISLAAVRHELEHPAAYAFAPSAFAVANNNALIENSPTPAVSNDSFPLGSGLYSIVFNRVSDKAYDYIATTRLSPRRLQYAEEEWYGGPEMFPYVITSVLAQAEKKVDGEEGPNARSLPNEMIKAIAIDTARRPEVAGKLCDPSFGAEDISISDVRDRIRFFGSP